MRPFGMPGRKLLSDLFTDKHIDRPFRDYVPLLTVGDEVLWAVGVCVSERLRVTPDTRAQCALVRWTCQLIWETQ
jgi:tRNA(Ile)-lysidine synthetase-like protein